MRAADATVLVMAPKQTLLGWIWRGVTGCRNAVAVAIELSRSVRVGEAARLS